MKASVQGEFIEHMEDLIELVNGGDMVATFKGILEAVGYEWDQYGEKHVFGEFGGPQNVKESWNRDIRDPGFILKIKSIGLMCGLFTLKKSIRYRMHPNATNKIPAFDDLKEISY
jgi:hypothetical protein